MIMHARLGCVACQAKLRKAQQTRQGLRSPNRADRSPSPCCEHSFPSMELGLERPRGRERTNSVAGQDATQCPDPPRPSLFSFIEPPSNTANRANSRERRRARRQQETAAPAKRAIGTFGQAERCVPLTRGSTAQATKKQVHATCKRESSPKAAQNACGYSTEGAPEDEPCPELSPDMPMRKLPDVALGPSFPGSDSIDYRNFRREVCEDFINIVKERFIEKLPSWAEVFAKCGSRWEPEGQPETKSPVSPRRSVRSESPAAKTEEPGPEEPGPVFGRQFVSVEECLQFLRTPTPLYQRTCPRQFTTVEECMEFLKTPPEFPRKKRARGSRGVDAENAANDAAVKEQDEAARRAAEAALRDEEAAREAARILALRSQDFNSRVDWAFAVLDTTADGAARDPAVVQRCFRGLMRKMHPDKVGQSSDLARAVELLREAKDVGQKHVLEVKRPGPPHAFQAATLCSVPGKRRIRLQWSPPVDQMLAPIHRYVVRVIDPVCGHALKIAVLEPDYREDLRRFVSVEELATYVLAEEELFKIPGLWKQPTATVQVAAANEAGESPWAVFKVPLDTR